MGLSSFDIFKAMCVNGAHELSKPEWRSLRRTLFGRPVNVAEGIRDADCGYRYRGGPDTSEEDLVLLRVYLEGISQEVVP